MCNEARFEDAVGIFPEFIDGPLACLDRSCVLFAGTRHLVVLMGIIKASAFYEVEEIIGMRWKK